MCNKSLLAAMVLAATIAVGSFASVSSNGANGVPLSSVAVVNPTYEFISTTSKMVASSRVVSELYEEVDNDYTIDDYYATYVRYMLNTNNGTVRILTFKSYLEYSALFSDLIPSKYLYAFINEALKQDISVRYLYAIAKQETLNFKFFKSLRPNKNGTVDYGLMGFNSGNINDKFLAQFFYYDGEYDSFNHKNQLHILKVCTAYIKSLIRDTGSFYNALICYNGGFSKWYRGKPVKAAVNYASIVSQTARKYYYRSKALTLVEVHLNYESLETMEWRIRYEKSPKVINRFTDYKIIGSILLKKPGQPMQKVYDPRRTMWAIKELTIDISELLAILYRENGIRIA